MGAIENIKFDFVERTKDILVNGYDFFKENDREVTFLLNCLLGLIVTVSENKKDIFNGRIDDEFLKFIPEKLGFVKSKTDGCNLITSDEIMNKVLHKVDIKSIENGKKFFIEKIRNGIAHQNIEPINESGKWVGVKIWNENKSGNKDFEIDFTVEELKKFALKIADDYLEANK